MAKQLYPVAHNGIEVFVGFSYGAATDFIRRNGTSYTAGNFRWQEVR